MTKLLALDSSEPEGEASMHSPSTIQRDHCLRIFLLVLALPLCAQRPQLGPAPRIEKPPLANALRSTAAAEVAPTGIDTTSREAVIQLYLASYVPFQNFPMGFTGDVAAGKAGDTSLDYKHAVITLVNFFRSMAGVPPVLTLDLDLSRKAQLAALMFAANNALSHTPPTNWIDYSADGADAAAHSNLCLDTSLPKQPGCVEGYIDDSGDNNAVVGHRRWILYPQTTHMGTGDIPPGPANQFGANDLWVINEAEVFGPRPATRQEYVTWPPPGYVPQGLVFNRWSFSYHDADFTGATVAMTRNGSNVPVQLQPAQQGFGENTVVWVVPGGTGPAGVPGTSRAASLDPRAAEVSAHVIVSNVVVSGVAQNFSYDVTAFDPTLPDVPANGIVSSASYQGGGVSPGEILTGFGFNLGPPALVKLTLGPNGLVATKLGPTRVLFDGVPGPMIYTLDRQVSVIAPFSISGKQNVKVQVEFNGVLSNAITLPVVATKPAVFSLNQFGSGQGAILNQDYSVNGSAHPAAHGSVVQIFMTGGGVLDKPGQDGQITSASPLRHLAAPVTVSIGDVDAKVQFAGAAPFLVLGVVQVNASVPNGVPSGDAPVVVTVGGVASQAGITVAIK
jgi:uncharacterized protein (TIGR03437 family)